MTCRVLLGCGIVSLLLYIATVVLAPARPLVVVLFVVYSLLIYAFAAGVWQSANGRLARRLAAVGLIGKVVLGLIATLFFRCTCAASRGG